MTIKYPNQCALCIEMWWWEAEQPGRSTEVAQAEWLLT